MSTLTGLARSLVQNGLLKEAIAIDAINNARLKQQALINFLIEQTLIDPCQTAAVLSQNFGLPLLNLDRVTKSTLPFGLVKENIMLAYQMLPLLKRGNNLFLAIFDPTQVDRINEIRFHTGLNVLPIIVEANKLKQTIDDLINKKISFTEANSTTNALDELALGSLTEIVAAENIEDLAVNDAPVVRFINQIINAAIKQNVSDIHFEPYEKLYRIRYRRDSILHEVAKLPTNLSSRFTARLKIIAKLDISERRTPQDGRFTLQLSDKYTIGLRINICPTLFGEKIVLRILDPHVATFGIEALGFTVVQQHLFEAAIKKPQGMLLVTGPTGSGKTVTQYTALTMLNYPEVNISTVEDPVEIYIPGINQVNINPKTGLSFATVLRAFLRQDPDIIMVGEIRDIETADIAIKAAQTGHLVLSTLHTNSSAETLTRLVSMGIAPFNLASSIKLIIAQRLVRRLCEHCKRQISLPEATLLAEGFVESELLKLQLYGPTGCQQCIKGYQGQIGIYEVMPITPAIEQIIMRNGNALDIAAVAKQEGMLSLRKAGLKKVVAGLTSLEAINSAVI